ncbi:MULTISPECIES: hypothetical protein [unclassified Caballeronia]|uniref:hypothetical protein n=1 Tax=unclassified Caballeronia TaxID=2646786 RepID=UPI0028659D97|nr:MULTISPECIES: hypothetical protein [unclassified Caballeronia]MDR5772069.1 hypothetical protein [Caballeronia sp. LZ002]MDR5847503.1 hypothetical protein [Caballeronia sp. LZ003]
MKRLFVLALAAFTSVAFGATTIPPSLVSPAGSTAGQAIISNGPSIPPAWGTVTLGGVSGTLAIANGGTGATSAATALSNLGAAPLASPTFTGTPAAPTPGVVANSTTLATTAWVRLLLASPPSWGNTTAAPIFATTLSATGLITPSSTAGIKGTTTNDSAQAGSIGEFPTPTNLSAVSLTSGTAANVSSASLTAGDYDVECTANFVPAATTTFGNIEIGVSTTSATQPGLGGYQLIQAPLNTGVRQTIKSGAVRILLASTTTVYCVATSVFGASTMTADGFMRVRRVR